MLPALLNALLAVAIAAVVWVLHHGPASLADSPACPGVLEALATGLFRLAPSAPAGVWLARANGALLPISIGVVTVLLRTVSRSWIVAASVGLAIAAQPVLNPSISPFDPAVVLVAAVTGLALTRSDRRRSRIALMAGCALTAMIAPASGLLVAATAGAYLLLGDSNDSRNARTRTSALTAVAIVGLSFATIWLTPAMPRLGGTTATWSCALPVIHASAWPAALRAALTSAGLYAFGLTALGLFTIFWRERPLLWVLIYAVVASLGTADRDVPAVRAFGPLLVGGWISLAVGSGEVVKACTATTRGRVAAAAFLVLLPVLQWPRLSAAPPGSDLHGVDRLSARDVREVLARLPDRSALVDEDASTAALVRALNGTWQRMGKTFVVVAREPDAVYQIKTGGPMRVYALPRSQSELQWLGIRLADADIEGIPGVAEVTAAVACQRVRPRWQAGASLAGAQTLSVVMNEPGEGHATILYLVSEIAMHPLLAQQSRPSSGGFEHHEYADAIVADRARLASDLRADQVNPDEVVRLGPFVAQVKLWRTAADSAVVAVDFGTTPTIALMRGLAPSFGDKVCPVIPYKAQDVRIGQ